MAATLGSRSLPPSCVDDVDDIEDAAPVTTEPQHELAKALAVTSKKKLSQGGNLAAIWNDWTGERTAVLHTR